MKKNLILLTAFFLLCFQSYAQVVFEKGYYISNNGQKTDCLIKNSNWRYNPTTFEYRLTEESASNFKTLEETKEFGIYNLIKYTRSKVGIDRSSSNINNLSTQRESSFHSEQLFLKVLIEGKAVLYQYTDKEVVRYFYSKDNSEEINQLVYKKYNDSGNYIRENNKFREQLLNDMKCGSTTFESVQKIQYAREDLEDFFSIYNECNNSQSVVYGEDQKKDLFNLNLRLGLNSSSFSVENTQISDMNANFGNEISLRIGVETEFILPFHNNKWGVIIEPTFQYYKSEKELELYSVQVDYASIEFPIGIRHYFFLNQNSKIFVNGSVVLDVPLNSELTYSTGSEFDITSSTNLGLGLGYKSMDKFSIELRYLTSRDIMDYRAFNSDYKTLSVILGYTIL